MADTNIIIIIVAFVVAIGAIYILYSIILFQGGSGKKGDAVSYTHLRAHETPCNKIP